MIIQNKNNRVAQCCILVGMLWIEQITSFGSFHVFDVSKTTRRAFGTSSRPLFSSVMTEVEQTNIFMPALSSTMTEGKIVSWLKSEGDPVRAGEAIMVVESDKADMDVEAFEDGFLAKIHVGEGEQAEVGALVAVIVANEADIASVQTGAAAPVLATPAAAPAASSTPVTTTTAAAAPEFDFTRIDMPALSSTMKEGKIVSWLKAEGDAVTSGEAIMVVESDKADMDVEAFEDGFLAHIAIQEGGSCEVGKPVAFIATSKDDIPALKAYAATVTGGGATSAAAPPASMAAAAATPKPAIKTSARSSSASSSGGGRVVASPLAKKRAEEVGLDLSTVIGTGPEGRITGADVEKAIASGGSGKAAVSKKPDAVSKPKWVPAPGVIAATPTAKAAAKKAGIDISAIVGTGNFGRVTLDDVKAATGEKKPAAAKKPSAPGAAVVDLPEGLVPFTGMQKAVSSNMEKSLTVPIFRVSRDIVTNKFDDLYQQVKSKGVSVSALLAKAVGLAVAKHPIMNSSYDPSGGIMYKSDINIAMAVAIDGGLITPTIKNANERNIYDIGENWKELVDKAKTGGLKPDDYQSGTFTITNLGMFGVNQFDAILPPGQGSILAIGATQEAVVPDKSAVLGLKMVKKMTVTLTCDHRPIYGADAALFLKTLADILENKIDMLLK